ncbi:F0F1 ATP synthase subunit delta [Neobacillus notoginsengisoli]|uniref:ATP synthase subunit delta n=1 Tax=Neobacillus notoginsengisoli TaxID=1578198 RepID=A0A417YQQ4_9BACI|nr:F0F1 ATP synthase subunit delta [Neobacillus notoginsengisoli]RHW37192.1 F0F1 ATP synthase subunit delta [Neobacillus notoginsengisoli]
MSTTIISKRYAVALFKLAEEKGLLDTIEEEIRVVKDVFSSNKELNAVLHSPRLSLDEKKAIVKGAFTTLNPYLLNTLMILIDRHRDSEIPGVAEGFIELANEARGIAEATVYSVRPLSDEERIALSASFAARVGKNALRIENIVDTDLLGGIKVRIGNRIFDGSLRGKLDRLERRLLI